MPPCRDRLRTACAEPLDHPALEDLRAASQQVVELVLADFTRLGDASVGASAPRAAMEQRLDEPLPENGTELARVLEQFGAAVAPFALRPQHPRFLAFVPAAPSFPAILGDWLTGGMNYFAGVWKEAAGPSQVELVVLDWLKQLVGYPGTAEGLLTGGGSEATLTALVAARERLPFAERARAVLYASDQRHWSFDRAARIAGFRPDQLHIVAADDDSRLSVSRLREAAARDAAAGKLPWLVLATAGTTNTGSVDPLAEVAELCAVRDLWLHVDAAYGWAAVLTEEGRRLLGGIERADSITLDPHKWLAQTYDVGCVLVRESGRLTEAFALRPEYLQDVQPEGDEVNFSDRGIALTRRCRALKIWFSVKVLGAAWFRRLIAHGFCLAELTQHLLERAGCFEIQSPRQLSVLCFRYVPAGRPRDARELDALNLALCEELTSGGRFFLSTTRLRGAVALRVCYVNWRTTASDVEELVQTLAELGRRVAG